MSTSILSEVDTVSGELRLPRREAGVFGHFQILDSLGRGAVGEVFRARAFAGRYEGQEVCLKLLGRKHLDQDSGDYMRSRAVHTLKVEAKVLGRLEHPNIARVLEHGLLNDVWFVAFELVRGANLAQVLRKRSTGSGLPADQVCAIGLQVAQALVCAHERDVLHRDVKPSNIMLGEDGQVKLVDFGLAKVRPAAASHFSHVGTPPYWAPEQIRAQQLTPAVDIYALGVVMVEAATGSALFEPHGVDDFSESVIRDGRDVDLAALPLPASLRPILARCLASEPEERPTAAELADELAAVLDRFPASQLGATAKRSHAGTRRRSTLQLSVFGVPSAAAPASSENDISTTFSDRHTRPTTFAPPGRSAHHDRATVDRQRSSRASAFADLGKLARQAQSASSLPTQDDAASDKRVGLLSLLEAREADASELPLSLGDVESVDSSQSVPTSLAPAPVARSPLPIPTPAGGMAAQRVPSAASSVPESEDDASLIADSLVEDGSTVVDGGRVTLAPVGAESQAPATPHAPKSSQRRWRAVSLALLAGALLTGALLVGLGALSALWSARPMVDGAATTTASPDAPAAVPAEALVEKAQFAPAPLVTVTAATGRGQPTEPEAAQVPTVESTAPAQSSKPPRRESMAAKPTASKQLLEQVTIAIIPEGEVWVDGKALGRAPVQIDLARGRHRIEGRLRDRKLVRNVRITKDPNPIVMDFWHADQ